MERDTMKIYLIRHSLTEGNLNKRYIGKTDEPLCQEGELLLKERLTNGVYPDADRIFTSPMKRCVQTARILYPGRELTVIGELSECDFGRFENKSFEELKDFKVYQQWLKSGGIMGFPGGESKEDFSKRCLAGFEKALRMCGCGEKMTDDGKKGDIFSAAFVVHGGTIMSIMEKYAVPSGRYYDFQIGNGEGYELILADDFAPWGRIYSRFDTGRSGVALPSGTDDRTLDHLDGKNYKRLSA
jgi:alpha-ribazole phosphatase